MSNDGALTAKDIPVIPSIGGKNNVQDALASTPGGGQVNSVVAGANVTVDATDPANPIVASTGGGTSTLTDGHVFVGNVSNVATDVAMSGDVTIANTGATALKNTGGGAAGPTGSATVSPIVTVDAQGRVTALSSATIAIPESAVTNLTTDLAAKQSTTLTNTHLLVGNGSNVAADVAMSGDATLANTGAVTLKNTGPGATGPLGSATVSPIVTIDAQGRVTALSSAAIAIPESAVTNLTTDLSDLQTQTAVQAAQLQVRTLADGGQWVYSGCALSPNATPTTLDMALGVVFMATTELVVAAQTAIATTIASLADVTNPKWVVVELDSSAVVQFNQGTAAANPAFPTMTTTRTPLGFLYVPANATNVDTLLTTNNGKAKLIDARNVRTVHTARLFATDNGHVTTNPSAAVTSLLTATIPVPANSLQVGDCFMLEAAGLATIHTSCLLRINAHFAGINIGDLTVPTVTLTASATPYNWTVRANIQIVTLGSGTSANFVSGWELKISNLNGGTVAHDVGEQAIYAAGTGITGFDSTSVSNVLDLGAKTSVSDAATTVTISVVNVYKYPK